MKKHYILEVVKSLTEQEVKGFLVFLGQLQLDKPKTLVKALRKALQHQPGWLLDKKHLHSLIYKDEVYQAGKLEKLMAQTNQLLRQFLSTQFYQSPENELEVHLDWLQILYNKGLNEAFIFESKKLERKTKALPESIQKIQFLFRHAHIKLENQLLHYDLKIDLGLPEITFLLDKYYLLQKIELDLNVLFQRGLKRTENLEPLLPVNFDALQHYQGDFLLSIFLRLHHALKQETVTIPDIIRWEQEIEDHKDTMDLETVKGLFLCIRNICTDLYGRGNQDAFELIYRFQQKHFEKGYLYFGGNLVITAYTNIANFAMLMGDFDWALHFIESQKNRIKSVPPGDNDFYKLSLARYYFYLKQYEKAMEYMPLYFTEPLYIHISKRLEIKILYDLNDDLFEYKMESFKMFVSRTTKKIIRPENVPYNLNFINILFQLTNATPNDKKRAVTIIRRIIEKKTVAEKEWLLEKARELGRLTDEEYEAALKGA
jgi:hypothetical protein